MTKKVIKQLKKKFLFLMEKTYQKEPVIDLLIGFISLMESIY
ncbi:hypothetical protein ACLZX5_03690 [Enterococcus faecium]